MINGDWNVYNKEGDEFKIHVKGGIVPEPSEYEGNLCLEWGETVWLIRPTMCCPNPITVERKSRNYLTIKEYGVAKEIWMRDLETEQKKAIKKEAFKELLMEK